MTSKEEAKALYEGKFFYEVISREGNKLTLAGPFDNIYYAVKHIDNKHFCLLSRKPATCSDDRKPLPVFEFVQVIDGMPRVAFTREEILVTTQVL